jgi:hypothetical protein
MAMFEFFLRHPRSVGETYIEHMWMSASFGFAMILGGLACLVHAVCPAWCEYTGSRTISALYARMVLNRLKPAAPFELDYAI